MKKAVYILLGCIFIFGCSANVSRVKDGEISDICSGIPDEAPFSLVSVGVDPDYSMMLYPEDSGWLGSDAACSIPLSKDKILWLFGDTLIGDIVDGSRSREFYFINSTIGIQDSTKPPDEAMTYYWAELDGKPWSFFSHREGTKGNFYWTTMGTMLGGELFIFCYPISYTGTEIIPDTTLIRVSNPLDDPSEWEWKAFDLGLGNTHQGFHSALYIDEPYIYWIGYDDPDNTADSRRAVLARVLIKDLLAGKLGEAYEFWVDGENGPVWGPDPENLVTLFTPGVTETGLQYDPELNLFFCPVYSAMDKYVYLTWAPELTGPWSEPVCIYEIPEHDVSFNISSYATRPHPELSDKPGEIIITYATNAHGNIEPLFTPEGLGIYYPRFIRLQLEKK